MATQGYSFPLPRHENMPEPLRFRTVDSGGYMVNENKDVILIDYSTGDVKPVFKDGKFVPA